MNEHELVRIASGLAQPMSLGTGEGSCATVASALVSASGNVYTGVCIDLRCGLGFCAERSAAAEMLKQRETWIRMMVAVEAGGKIVPPCGACREFLLQLDHRNVSALVIVSNDQTCTLADLLP